MPSKLEELERLFPSIPWREPVKMISPGRTEWHYACRICIVNNGIMGSDITALPTDRQAILDHISKEHS